MISDLDLHYYKICLSPVPPGEGLVTVDFKQDHKSRALEPSNNFSYCLLVSLQLYNELFACGWPSLVGFGELCNSPEALISKCPRNELMACKVLELCLVIVIIQWVLAASMVTHWSRKNICREVMLTLTQPRSCKLSIWLAKMSGVNVMMKDKKDPIWTSVNVWYIILPLLFVFPTKRI